MSPLVKIFLTLVGIGITSALLSPPFYWLMQEIGTGIFSWLKEVPFSRVFNRVLLVCILLSIGPLLIALKISNFRELGLQRNFHWKRDVSWGFLLALLPATILMTAYIYFGICQMRSSESVEWFSLLRVVATVVGVAVLEEVLFRGLLYGLSRQVLGILFSAVWTSALFAIVHFLRSAGTPVHPIDIWSGFREFSRFFTAAPPLPIFVFALASLFFIGLLFCWALEKTHSLALPIGLHMGWIFTIQTFNLFTRFPAVSSPTTAGKALPWVAPHAVSGSVPVGIFALLVIAITFLLCWLFIENEYKITASQRNSSPLPPPL